MSKLPGYEIEDGDVVYEGELTGNIIPMEWLNYIKREETGSVDTVAILLLGDIVYWYRAIKVRDEETGSVVGYRKRYKADRLQRSYDYYTKLYELGKAQSRNALKNLERLGLIEIEHRTITTSVGRKASNVTYIGLNVDKLKEISGGYQQKKRYPSMRNNSDPLDENSDTYTESTTETTINAENEKSKDTAYLDNVASILSGEHQEEYDAKVEARKSSTAKALQRGYSVAESYKAEISDRFNINPNWDTKTARSFLQWLNALPEEQSIEQFAHWWYEIDWRGQNGQPPTLTQIRELWPSAFVSERTSPHNIATEVWE